MKSLPSRGAWIEMRFLSNILAAISSLPSRGAWIEIAGGIVLLLRFMSLPSRGAWIEITQSCDRARQRNVAPLAGSVD